MALGLDGRRGGVPGLVIGGRRLGNVVGGGVEIVAAPMSGRCAKVGGGIIAECMWFGTSKMVPVRTWSSD